jgi:catechol-2,3-dioxygenase
MGAGQQIHLLRLPNPEAGIDRPEHGGRDRHVALLTDHLEAVASKLEQHGVTYSRSKSGRAALFCRDPDGNAIEIIQREKR